MPAELRSARSFGMYVSRDVAPPPVQDDGVWDMADGYGDDGFKRLADAALAASCATLSPNTADPCLVARLAAESRERSRSLTDPGTQARGAKRAAGSSAQDGAAGRGPAL